MLIRTAFAFCVTFAFGQHGYQSDVRIFEPGTISTGAYELTPTFTPDGRSAYYTLSLPEYGRKRFLVEAERTAAGWRPTRIPAFSGLHDDADPFVTRDGRRLFFLSKRPVTGATAKPDLDIWVVERSRIDAAWGAPRHLGPKVNGPGNEHYVTVTNDGTLFISAERAGGLGRGDLYRVRNVNGEYGDPENLGATLNTPLHETTPYVAPNGEYVIFGASGRPDAVGRAIDLYITFREGDGWTTPMNLGPTINSVADDYCPIVSPDGETLYFASERNFSDEQQTQITSYADLRAKLEGPGNSLGDVYFVPMAVVRRIAGR